MITQQVGSRFMQQNNIYIAFYKGQKTGKSLSAIWARFCDWLTRKTTKGKYSHCEIVYRTKEGDYHCFSASVRDGGVRYKRMALDLEKWDFVPIDLDKRYLDYFYNGIKGQGYDWLGAIGVVLKWRQSDNKWFCSEFCAAALGFHQSWRFSPNDLYIVCKRMAEDL